MPGTRPAIIERLPTYSVPDQDSSRDGVGEHTWVDGGTMLEGKPKTWGVFRLRDGSLRFP
jgi:hypothetical protein